jgi:hypothetical protein
MFKNISITLAKNISHAKKIKTKSETLKNRKFLYIFFQDFFFGQKIAQKYVFFKGKLPFFNVF